MARLPEVLEREKLTPEGAEAFDYVLSTRGRVGVPFSVLLNRPQACRRVAEVGTYVRFESSLPRPIIELATITAAREWDCDFEWRAHLPAARETGASDAVISAIENKSALAGVDAEQALIVEAVRGLLREHRLDDDTYKQLLEKYGPEGVIDLITTVGYYAMLGGLINALEIVRPG